MVFRSLPCAALLLCSACTADPYRDGAWHHMAVSYDGNAMQLYLDGVNKGSKTTYLATGASTMFLGRSVLSNGFYYTGMLDDVAIFNVALTATEVQEFSKRTTAPDNSAPASFRCLP